MANSDEECDIRPGTVTPKKLPKQSGGGGHEFVTELPEKGDEGVEYVLMDDFSDCSTYRGTFVWNEDCGGWIQTSGSGGGAVERYTFEQTATGWRAKRNNTVIFTYVDKDTIDSYENTADGFQITRNGVVIFTHTDGGGGKTYTIESTSTGWVFKEDGTVKFTYTEPANDPSDGTYFTSGTLTTAITGTTTVAASSVTGLTLADVVIGETLIYDEAGTVGRVTAVNGTNLTVETITTAPGERRGTRLGAVDDYTDLPATCAAAVAMGWQTPLAGDFAYVRTDTSHDSHLTEWVIQSIDASCNITWGYSHTLNAGNYVLDIYKYGDYPSGSPIPKNPDGSVTLPKDADTKYDFENIMDGSKIVGWRVKDHDTGTVLYTYTDLNDNDTYTFEDVTVSGKIVGWRVKDKNGTVIYTYTDLNDKSDGTYFTSTTLDDGITNQTTVAASSVTGLTLADVVIGETLIFDGDGTVGRVTAVTGSDLTVETITVSGSGDASSYVYKTTGTLDTTVDNTVNLALSTLKDALGNTPTASDIIIGKTLAWDADGTVALAVAISGTDVTFKTITTSGGGGSITYNVNNNGDAVKSAMYKLIQSGKADTPNNNDYGIVQVAKNAIMPFHKISGDFENGSTQGTFKVPDGMRIEVTLNMTLDTKTISGTANPTNIRAFLYNVTDGAFCKGDSNEQIPSAYSYSGEYGGATYAQAPYVMSRNVVVQWENKTGHTVEVGFRVCNFTNDSSGLPAAFRTDATAMTAKEIGRYVDPIKYLDNSEGLQDTPVGNIISYMGNNVPRHYLACDGTIYNIGDYPELETHFIEEFGSVNYFGGDGTTTWAVPDLKGEFLRGTGTNSHTWTDFKGSSTTEGGGSAVGVHQKSTVFPGIWTGETNDNRLIMVQHVQGQGLNPDKNQSASSFDTSVATVTNQKNSMVTAYTSRPTNTSVKYCIKYESTMQVILGADQYAVRGTFARNTAISVWQLNTLTATDGDTSLVKNGVFYAPEDGYYQLTANTGWTSGQQVWMTWQRQATALSSNTQAIANANMLLNNTGDPASSATTNGVSREVLSGAVWLNKGDPVTLQTYCGRTVTDANGKYEWSIVRLTGSVDINEINLIAADDVYSTDEQLVGSYLGKPLYKKTLTNIKTSSTTSDIIPYSSLSSNVDKSCIVKWHGKMMDADAGNTVASAPCYYAAAAFLDCFFQNDGIHYVKGTQYATANRTSELTFYYTKTSDTAGSAPNKNSLLLTRPDLWTPGTEYDFGGGLYGKRLTGSATVTGGSSSSQYMITLGSGIQDLVDFGGWRIALNGNKWAVPGCMATDFFEAYAQAGTTTWYGQVTGSGGYSGTRQYDIWFTYHKV